MKPVRERGSIPGSVVIHRDVTSPFPPCAPYADWPREDCNQCWGTGLVDGGPNEDDAAGQ
jgi:hypothetical protein